MPNDDSFAPHYAQQYANMVTMLLQDKGGKLRSLVTTSPQKGEGARLVNQIGTVEMQPVTGRFQPMGRVDAPKDARWLYPQDWDLPQLVDTFDQLRLIAEDPKSALAQAAVMAAGRREDKIIIEAALGGAFTGQKGTTVTTFPSSQVVAVNYGGGAATGLTVAKMRAARKLLMKNQVDLEAEQITLVITSEEYDDLFGEAQIVNADYNGRRSPLVDGRIQSFMGFNIKVSEALEVDANGYRRCLAFAQRAIHLGIWNEPTSSVDKRADLQGIPLQLYLYLTMGATRLEEKAVVEIKCAEAA